MHWLRGTKIILQIILNQKITSVKILNIHLDQHWISRSYVNHIYSAQTAYHNYGINIQICYKSIPSTLCVKIVISVPNSLLFKIYRSLIYDIGRLTGNPTFKMKRSTHDIEKSIINNFLLYYNIFSFTVSRESWSIDFIIINYKGRQSKDEREWYSPNQFEDPSP